jgi:cytochrome P450
VARPGHREIGGFPLATTEDERHVDLLDPEAFAGGHPWEQYRWLREHRPVHRHAEPGGPGFWAVTRYEDVREVGRDHGRFSSVPTIMIPDPPAGAAMTPGGHQMMLMADPPVHTILRRLISGEFTPRGAGGWRARVDELAALIVDEVVERGSCDLVEDLAGEMPSFVVAELFGLPHQDGRDLYRLTETIHASPGSVPAGASEAAVVEMMGRAAEVWQQAVAGTGTSALVRALTAAEVDGRPFDGVDFALLFLLLVDAGGDTTRNLVAGGMDVLFGHPDQRAWLTADLDGRLPTAIEELLRWVSPVVYMRRTATVDSVIGGTAVAAGDKVVMYYASANRDPAAFFDPDRLDLARTPNRHVAFGGGGPHFCLGAHLARIEIAAMLRAVLTRLVDLEPTGPTEWLPSVFISGPQRLPVRFSPGPRQAG